MPDIGDILLPEKKVDTDAWEWATVTQLSPLRVRFDGETTPVTVAPVDTVGKLLVGDRVWVQFHNKQFVVLGKAGGYPKPYDSGWIDLSVSGGFAGTFTVPSGLYGFQARQIDNTVRFRGTMTNSSFTGGWWHIAYVPTGIAPLPTGRTTALSVVGNTTAVRYAIMQDNELAFYATAASAAWFTIGGSYTVD